MSLPSEIIPVGLLATGATEAAGYNVERSLRFNSADSAYLSRTPSVAGNRKTWTWSGWVKRSSLTGAEQHLWVAGVGQTGNTTFQRIFLGSDDRLRVSAYSYAFRITTQVFRDFSAWFHLVVAVDTTQATANNRVRVYVNGAEVTAFDTINNPAQNDDTGTNSAALHYIGAFSGPGRFFNGYLADVHLIDGQQLTPSSFGEFDTNGVWQPIEYTGTYGTNGFHLPFSNNSTAAALGTDTSGNSNTWTVNNISVTAGAGNDSLVDVPTNGTETDTGVGGEVRGNYATWNPLDNQGLTLANGNLDVSWNASSWYNVKATIGVSTGKWYYEYTVNSGATYQIIGLFATTTAFPAVGSVGYMTVSASGWGYQLEGSKSNNNSFTSTGTTAAAGDVIIVAFDMDAAKVWFGVNGVWLNSGDPATGANAAFSNLSGTLAPAISMYGAQSGSLNFGARSFAYTAPSGFKALCTANLPDPVVAQPSTVMDVKLYTGNGSTQTISGLGFSPDLVWIKERNAVADHALYDIVRGTQARLESNTTDAEATSDSGLTAFNSDGFALSTLAQVNTNNDTYVAWCWDAGSSTVSNTDGSITSQVRANASAGFSIVSGPGNTYFGGTLGHGLGVAPEFILSKDRDTVNQWYVYHKSLTNPNNYNLVLNSTAAEANFGSNLWNVTSTTFGSDQGITGRRGIHYCFAPVEGYSAFGSYTGNGSADGTFVYTGFRPRWVVIKASSASGSHWMLFDTARSTYNLSDDQLYANLSNAETTANSALDFLANGFKCRADTFNNINGSSITYIYAAFAESPFQYSRAR